MAHPPVHAECGKYGFVEDNLMTDSYIPVRLSHLLGYCAVGSVIRGTKFLVTPMDTSFWTDSGKKCSARPIPYVDQVRSALGIRQELREPPIARIMENGQVDGAYIPAVRFPSWMQCPKCHLLYCAPWREQSSPLQVCLECENQPTLEQVPWVFVHPEGYMADVPWHRFAHKDAKGNQQSQCGHKWDTPYLKLIENSSGYGYIIKCTDCHARAEFKPGPQGAYGNLRCQPWLRQHPVSQGSETLSENDEAIPLAEILSINDTRVHRPVATNAIVIPPESRIRKGSVVDRIFVSSQKRKQIDKRMPRLARDGMFRQWADEFRCETDQIKDAIEKIKHGYPTFGLNFTQGKLLESEYNALTESIPDLSEDEDFVTYHFTKDWHDLKQTVGAGSHPAGIIDLVNDLVSVNRLKEIMVLKGFQRLNAKMVPPDISGNADWLPALELFGEGIFFTLQESLLSQWENIPSVIKRTAPVEKRFKTSGLNFEPPISPSPRFILLHTLAHLIIRELESIAGYPAASLKERIYSSTGKNAMAGILIYVAVPDVEGSLGGLFELAQPNRFLRLLSAVFDQAQWCSLDPVCSEHDGQGPSFLNRAACHACTLIPESSCAFANTLLDRGLVKGFSDDTGATIPGLLGKQT